MGKSELPENSELVSETYLLITYEKYLDKEGSSVFLLDIIPNKRIPTAECVGILTMTAQMMIASGKGHLDVGEEKINVHRTTPAD